MSRLLAFDISARTCCPSGIPVNADTSRILCQRSNLKIVGASFPVTGIHWVRLRLQRISPRRLMLSEDAAMNIQLRKYISLTTLGALMLILTAGVIPAQQPLPQLPPPGGQTAVQPGGQPGDPDGIEVLTRGPVHEAYATTAEQTAPSPVIAKQPPDPIEELPPDQKPEGDNVQWMPGYWHWDDEAEQFIWISGFWRVVPPDRVWVPGSWREVRGGWQWVGGFWQRVKPAAASAARNSIPAATAREPGDRPDCCCAECDQFLCAW